MAGFDNKCPLCAKMNPDTEWVCEDCGAELPMHGQRGVQSRKPVQLSGGVPPNAPVQVPVNIPTQMNTPKAKRESTGLGYCSCGCMILFCVFLFLPWTCSHY